MKSFKVRDRVWHPIFGDGIITGIKVNSFNIDIKGENFDLFATVYFFPSGIELNVNPDPLILAEEKRKC